MTLSRTLRIKGLQFLEHWQEAGFRPALERSLFREEEAIPAVKDLTALGQPRVDLETKGYRIVDIRSPADLPPAWIYPLRSRHARGEAFLDRGYASYAALHEDRIVADVWYCTRAGSPRPHPHVGWFGFDLGDGGAYLFDFHVLADERGKSVTTPFLHTVLHRLKERGFERAYGYYAADNVPALWFHRMLGYEERPPVVIRRRFLFESAEPKV